MGREVGKGLFFAVVFFFIYTQPIHQYTHLLHVCVIIFVVYLHMHSAVCGLGCPTVWQ